MATDQSFIEFVCEQADLGKALTFRKMFGEYALYLGGRVVALACDNQLFVKPTAAGREVLGTVDEHPPYPGARPHFRIGSELDDRELLKQLLRTTARVLPPPQAKPGPKAKLKRKSPATAAKKK